MRDSRLSAPYSRIARPWSGSSHAGLGSAQMSAPLQTSITRRLSRDAQPVLAVVRLNHQLLLRVLEPTDDSGLHHPMLADDHEAETDLRLAEDVDRAGGHLRSWPGRGREWAMLHGVDLVHQDAPEAVHVSIHNSDAPKRAEVGPQRGAAGDRSAQARMPGLAHSQRDGEYRQGDDPGCCGSHWRLVSQPLPGAARAATQIKRNDLQPGGLARSLYS